MLTADQMLDRYFLEIRSKLLEVAASLDRVDRSLHVEGAPRDARRDKITAALAVLSETTADNRAERLQLLFSRDYDPNWLKDWEL